jgi:hypothetical protein
VPGTHKQWKVRRLQSKPPKGLEKENTKTAEQMMQAAALNKKCLYTLQVSIYFSLHC